MKQINVTVPWTEGLHFRPAARLVKAAHSFRSSISLKLNGRIADARSILAVILLSASLGTVLDLEVNGEDEDLAITSIATLFESDGTDGAALLPQNEGEVTDQEDA